MSFWLNIFLYPHGYLAAAVVTVVVVLLLWILLLPNGAFANGSEELSVGTESTIILLDAAAAVGVGTGEGSLNGFQELSSGSEVGTANAGDPGPCCGGVAMVTGGAAAAGGGGGGTTTTGAAAGTDTTGLQFKTNVISRFFKNTLETSFKKQLPKEFSKTAHDFPLYVW
jgi:hypothetical protein